MTTDTFLETYKGLNEQQKKAVDTIEGPVMVIAGPGTGKTQILTLRIANILRKTDMEPENVLALTFTESGVASMRRRLMELIGGPAYSVMINTFHGFCNDIIKNYPEEFPRIIGSENITEVDQIRIIEDALRELPIAELRPFGDTMYYLRPILSSINELKREGVTVERFEDVIQWEQERFEHIEDLVHDKGPHKGKMKGHYQKLEKNIRKNGELARIYAYYQRRLTDDKRYDYNDMIMEVLDVLSRNQNLLLMLQEQYQYILVDEHQDTNNAQNRIIELLGNFHKDPNLFVVGDEKQAIYRFQGASLENFLYFKNLYPNAELIVLEDNYRSTQAILDSAHSVIPGKKELRANVTYENRPIKVCACGDEDAERYTVARDIQKKIESGVAPEEIAVLYRDNRDMFPISDMLQKMGVPFVVGSDQDILGDDNIRKLIMVLRAVNEFGSQEAIMEAMHVDFLRIGPLDLYKVIEYANRNRTSVYEVIRSLEALQSADLKLEAPQTIHDFYVKLMQWKTLSRNRGFAEFFEIVMRESGFLGHLLASENPVEKIGVISGLFDEIKKLIEAHREYTLEDFFAYLDTLRTHNILIKKNISGQSAGKVRLMTAHKSKGLEYGYVYIINAYNGHWGNKRRKGGIELPKQLFLLSGKDEEKDEDENADERRLFYVALTRAKKEVIIAYAKENANKREQLPSQFIGELRSDLITDMDSSQYETEFARKREVLFAPRVVSKVDIRDKEYIRDLFLRNGFSVTALNNYLECPWKYFYTNLLRIPKAPSKHQMYGIAIHGALKDFFDAMREREVDKQFLVNAFTRYLNRQPLSKDDYDESVKKGIASLGGYYDTYHGAWRTNTLTEFSVNGVMVTPEIRLTGKIDKIEFIGTANKVNVVDYKTGKPKSRNVIEGNTRDSEGNIKRQLVFYKLLLDKYEEGKKYNMISGDIDFVEPNEKGVYKKEMFEVVPEEVSALEAEVVRVGTEILEGAFWERRCADPKCEYCALRDLMT